MQTDTGSRISDPATSHTAGSRARRFAPRHQDQIVGVLWRAMIPPEIAKLTGLTVVQIDRRRAELVREGRVRIVGARDGFEQWERVEASL